MDPKTYRGSSVRLAHSYGRTDCSLHVCPARRDVQKNLCTFGTDLTYRGQSTRLAYLGIQAIHILVPKTMNRVPHPSNGKNKSLTTRFRHVLPMVRVGGWLQEIWRGQDVTTNSINTRSQPRARGFENVQKVLCTFGLLSWTYKGLSARLYRSP